MRRALIEAASWAPCGRHLTLQMQDRSARGHPPRAGGFVMLDPLYQHPLQATTDPRAVWCRFPEKGLPSGLLQR
jgi:hypothetical protein